MAVIETMDVSLEARTMWKWGGAIDGGWVVSALAVVTQHVSCMQGDEKRT